MSKLFVVFNERYMTRMGENLQRSALSHAVPAGSRKVAAAFNFISERTVLSIIETTVPKVAIE
jgi:hypothetical protein